MQIVLLFTGCINNSTAPVITTVSSPDELDEAIREAADYFNENIPKGNKLLILNMQSN
jgi:hypothetical protein